jgi:hypothetical protein
MSINYFKFFAIEKKAKKVVVDNIRFYIGTGFFKCIVQPRIRF